MSNVKGPDEAQNPNFEELVMACKWSNGGQWSGTLKCECFHSLERIFLSDSLFCHVACSLLRNKGKHLISRRKWGVSEDSFFVIKGSETVQKQVKSTLCVLDVVKQSI